MIPDNVSNYDFGGLLDGIIDFFDTFFNDVMNSDLTGLIMYLWYCIPSFIRSYMLAVVMLCAVVVLVHFIKGGGDSI